jgi:tetratricopeptide (TPR) repeat protein
MSCYTSIGDIYNNLGYTEPIASRYFNKAKRLVSEEYSRLQQLQKIDWLLASTRYLQNAGLLDAELSSKLAKVEEDMNNLMYSDPSKKNASNWMALAQSKSTLAEVKLKEGNIGEAVALARSAYSLRLSTLPRTDSKSATGMMSTTKWKVIKAYADSLEQTGTLYQIQGSGREAELYFLRGLDLAKSLGITKMKTRFLLKLAQLKLKRKQMEDSAQYFESLVEVKKSHEKLMSESGSKSNPTTMSPYAIVLQCLILVVLVFCVFF